VKHTHGAIGLIEQREALEAAARLLPAGAQPVLMGDRFYGSPDLIAWCGSQGWDWRLRLKQGRPSRSSKFQAVFRDPPDIALREKIAHYSVTFRNADPLCIAICSVLLLLISYCGASGLAWCT
jgi:hypothetical protein